MRRRRVRLGRMALGMVGGLFLAGLAEAEAGAAAFVRTLLDKEVATFSDACRLMVVLHTKQGKAATFEDDLAQLRRVGIAAASWRIRQDEPVTRGHVCYMLCKTLGIKGGLTMRVMGPTRRYAFRECVFLKLLPQGHQQQYLSGEEMVAVIGLAEEYLRQQQ